MYVLYIDPEAYPASCTMGTGSFPRVRCGRGVTSRAVSLLSVRAFVAYERVKPTNVLYMARRIRSAPIFKSRNLLPNSRRQNGDTTPSYILGIQKLGKIKQSVFRPGQAQRVPGG